MLDKIMDLIRSQATNVVMNNNQIPEDKKQATVDTTTEAMANGLKQNLNMNNLSSLAGLFGQQSNNSTATGSPILESIKNMVAGAISQKVGLSPIIANSLAAAIVPSVMSAFSNRMKDPNDKEFSIESLAGMFGGNTAGNTTGKEGIMGTIGKLFG